MKQNLETLSDRVKELERENHQLKQINKTLQENEDRFRNLFDLAPLAYQSLDSEGAILEVNQTWLDSLSYSKEEVLGRSITEFLHPDWIGVFRKNFPVLKKSGRVIGAQFTMIKRDNSSFQVSVYGRACFDPEGNFKHTHCLLHNITEQQKSQALLKEKDATLNSILAAAPVAIGLVQNRVFNWVNPVMLEMLGYERDEILGKSSRMLYPSQEEFDRVGEIKYTLIKNNQLGEIDTVWLKKDGTSIDVNIRSTPLNSENISLGVIFTALDISDRKKAEKQSLELERHFLHLQKLESLGVLAGGIAHDFNNLLMAILGNADLALSDLPPASPVCENLLEIEKASHRAADLCKHMLAYSGRGRFVVQTTDLSTVIKEIKHMIQISVSKSAVIKYNLCENLPPIVADTSQIHQVVMNLVVNASEAIGNRSGVISISTGASECDRSCLSGTYLDENLPEGFYCFLEVSDTGCGMDHETEARLFDPFFSTKFTGRGLGMSAVLGIVRGHKGAIKVSSVPGKSTSIRIYFPLADEEPFEDPRKSSWTTSGKILLVDDEETVRTLAKRMLERIGFSVIVAENGRKAVEIFREHSSEIDCVLLDLTMPHMDGETACLELRKINPGVKVIISSGYSEQDVTERFSDKNISGIIPKPYTLGALVEMMRKIFRDRIDG